MTVFLALLTVAVQITLNLYSTSVVTAAAHDAARLAATSGRHPLDPADVRAAEGHARTVLGGLGDEATFTWDDSDPDVVRLRVVVPSPRVLLPVVDGALGLDVIDRTVSVRREVVQG